jgi:uncharacterized membrane protein
MEGSRQAPESSKQAPARNWTAPTGARLADPENDARAQRLARGLGWFSIGLGLAELLAPRFIARLSGSQGRHTGLIRLFGLREIAAGLMIFSEGKKPARGMWARVGGDAMDLTALGAAALSRDTNKAGVAFAAANVLAVTALDLQCAKQLSLQTGLMTEDGSIRLKKSIVINRSPEDLYAYWRDFQNLPRFMYHLESVEMMGDGRSRWVTKAPAGKRIEWVSEVVQDTPNELIAWRSLAGADVENRGFVRFEPRTGGRGTIVRLEILYRPPGGIPAMAFAKLFNQSPDQQADDDLRRLKQVMETGEVMRSDGSPEGTGQMRQRPAQPMA